MARKRPDAPGVRKPGKPGSAEAAPMKIAPAPSSAARPTRSAATIPAKVVLAPKTVPAPRNPIAPLQREIEAPAPATPAEAVILQTAPEADAR